MFYHILTVCTGNICRSPMAEAVLAARLQKSASVSSAGVAAWPGRPAEPEAIEVCQKNGLDISRHRARQFDEALLEAHPLVLVMEEAHRRWIARRFPHMREQVFLLGHCMEGIEVPDPYGEDRDTFSDVFEQIRHCCEAWAERLRVGEQGVGDPSP
jgi:protein-tyrosine phosphatase